MTEPLAEIHRVLGRHIGLDAASIGARAIEAAVRARMAATGASDLVAYLAALTARRDELDALVEEIVVPETWFLRDRVPFTNLAAHAAATRGDRRPGDRLRVLSVPCSTGEEPYSIAIALLDAGLAPADFAIDAIDISQRALAVAERAIYGASSFRGDDIEFRDRHFRATPAGWELSGVARESVRFARGNLLEQGTFEHGRRYHAVFCRNLLIYLTAEARVQAITRLEALLEPGGLFVAGHAEGLQVMDPRFRAVDVSGSFTFVRAKDVAPPRTGPLPMLRAPAAPAAPPPARPAQERQETARLHSFPRPAKKPAGRAPPAEAAPAPPARDLLDEAAALADRGDLAAAAELCAQHFRVVGPTAQGYALLGTIRQAGGQIEDAEAMFSRALYCDPGHYESLVHLALLRERRGDRAGADNLRRRAGKVRDRGGAS